MQSQCCGQAQYPQHILLFTNIHKQRQIYTNTLFQHKILLLIHQIQIHKMWKKIGIKTPSQELSLSKASSERKYKRRLPYNQIDSLDLKSPTFSEDAFSEDKGQDRLFISNLLNYKKDNQHSSALDPPIPFRKTNSALKLNTQGQQQISSSVHLKDCFRSCSAKILKMQSNSNSKVKRLVQNQAPVQESSIVEQQGIYEQVKNLRARLKKSQNLNDFLLGELKKYKILYQDIGAKIKQQLDKYQNSNRYYISSLTKVIDKINCIKFEPSTPTTNSTLERFPQWTPLPDLKQQSITRIINIVDQLKNKIKNRQSTRSPQSSSQSPKNLRKYLSPRSSDKKHQNALAAVIQLQQLMDR